MKDLTERALLRPQLLKLIQVFVKKALFTKLVTDFNLAQALLITIVMT